MAAGTDAERRPQPDASRGRADDDESSSVVFRLLLAAALLFVAAAMVRSGTGSGEPVDPAGVDAPPPPVLSQTG